MNGVFRWWPLPWQVKQICCQLLICRFWMGMSKLSWRQTKFCYNTVSHLNSEVYIYWKMFCIMSFQWPEDPLGDSEGWWAGWWHTSERWCGGWQQDYCLQSGGTRHERGPWDVLRPPSKPRAAPQYGMAQIKPHGLTLCNNLLRSCGVYLCSKVGYLL